MCSNSNEMPGISCTRGSVYVTGGTRFLIKPVKTIDWAGPSYGFVKRCGWNPSDRPSKYKLLCTTSCGALSF